MIWYSWIVAALLLLVIEIMTPGVFFFACLSVGCFAAGIVSLLPVPSWVIWAAFLSISVVSIYFIRPLAMRLFPAHQRKSNIDALMGTSATVTEAIHPPSMGTVKAGGEFWRAGAAEALEKGTEVTILSVDGTHLNVKKKEA